MDVDPDVGMGEVLSGAQLYHHLVQENEASIASAQQKLHSYESLQSTLKTITDRARRPVLAPVANGLGFFEAELNTTNNIIVLIGDGWFVERSASDAAEIAGRRVAFLQRELQVLEEEKKNLSERQELFLSEVPESGAALESIMQQQGQKPASASAVSGNAGASSDVSHVTDPALTTFDEQDELTEDELIELEKELCDVIDDDEIVEKAILDRMIAKKERRVAAELAKKNENLVRTAHVDVVPATNKNNNNTSKQSCVFASPADIGRAACSTSPSTHHNEEKVVRAAEPLATSPPPPPPPPPAVPASPNKGSRRVTFSETAQVHVAGTSETKSEPLVQPPPPRPSRVSIAVGDIVEKDCVPAGAQSAAAPNTRKRKSLFLQEMDGDE